MKTPAFGIRTCILVLYLIVSIGGLIVLNRVFQTNQQQIQNAMGSLELSEDLRQIRFYSHEDSLEAAKIMQSFAQAKGIVKLSLSESRFYAALTLLIIIVVSSVIFVVVLSRLSKPLRELKNATDQIRAGNFSVHLPETGIHEMKLLKNSFNVMSRELEAVQTRLLVAEKEMIWKDLSRILAHEIKNPLTPIQLAVQRLEERIDTDPGSVSKILNESLDIIKQEIENLRLLAQDFSSFAKVSKAQGESFDPAKSISEICKSYAADYNLALDLQPNLVISFDKTHFYQIITNILQNAMDASDAEKPIALSLKRDKSYVVLSIKDSGSGIEPEDLARIFEPYFTRKSKGTGLGLALVKKLCEANGAIVRAKSKIGEGSEFTLIIEEGN
ncbi:MAG: HAMP domain-containing sensor histidine kinase [Candidatus Cloacimonas sp.]|jgi:nitrogen fixation/metabolism regulation signal transduction histidine kinase|nr:HAMP domain-containing sensor histidine kinase [Candidatus Cloacimonas sp.]